MLGDTSVFDPILNQAKSAAKKTACLSNVKQLALGTHMYAADHDDRFPNASRWRAQIMPYVRSASIFRCPEDKSGALSSYRLNPRLSGVVGTTVDDVVNTVLIYEGDGTGFLARHNGQGSVAFTDGHAKVVTQSAYTGLRQRP